MLFQPFVEKLGRNLNSKNIAFEFDWFNWFEPRFVSLDRYIILYYIQAVIPN